MRSLCIYTKAGKDTILDTCSELVVSWQQLMSDISTEEKFACQPNGLLFRTLEAQMNLLYIVGDVVMNDYEQMSASAAPLQSSGFRSARTSYSQTASGRSPGGPCPTLRNWTMRWLSLALGASDAVAQFDQILSAKSDSNGYKSGYEDMKFVLRQKLSALWTAAPFFINSVYQCHGTSSDQISMLLCYKTYES